MFRYSIRNYFWWLIENELAGMPMPFIDPERRKLSTSSLTAFDDDIPFLHSKGIKSIVSLVKGGPSYAAIYSHVGIGYLSLPVSDGEAPSLAKVEQFNAFFESNPRPCVVHCEGGLGRTGTMLAAFLMQRGAGSTDAINQVRTAQPAAIESDMQIRFLRTYETQIRRKSN